MRPWLELIGMSVGWAQRGVATRDRQRWANSCAVEEEALVVGLGACGGGGESQPLAMEGEEGNHDGGRGNKIEMNLYLV